MINDGNRTHETLTNPWIAPVAAGTQSFTLRLPTNPNVGQNCNDSFSSSSSSTLSAIWLP